MMEKFHNFHIPRDRYSGAIVTWCYDNFGKPTQTGRARWDTYQYTIYEIGRNNPFVKGRKFIFFQAEDAMAFKLRCL